MYVCIVCLRCEYPGPACLLNFKITSPIFHKQNITLPIGNFCINLAFRVVYNFQTNMIPPRCFLHFSKHISRNTFLHTNIKKTYSVLHHKYSTNTPRKYTDRHEWVTVDKDVGTVGISNYAQESLGDVVFAQLPDVGTKIMSGDECGALESVKAASEIYSPVTGIILEKNAEVENKPGLINTSCYDKGWLFKLKMTKLDELKELMTETEYENFLKTDVIKEE